MRKIRFLLFALLAILFVTNVNAITVGNQFTRDGITYEVTLMRPAGNGLSELNEVKGKHPKLAVFCGCSIVATFAQKRCLH